MIDWSRQRVLVTGGAGFLGSGLCHALVGRGALVTVVDNFSESGGANAGNLCGLPVHVVRADLTSDDVSDMVQGATVIFNLAARTGHLAGQLKPAEDLDINTRAQLRLIEAVRASSLTPIVVHASTRQVYGRSDTSGVSEIEATNPPDINSITKLAGEQFWMLEGRLTGVPVVSLRLTNCYGPRQRIKDAEQGFLGHWIGQVLRGERFEVWGGDQLRDVCYLDDVVDALLRAAADPGCYGKVLNVGGYSSHTLKEVALLLQDLSGTGFCIRPFPSDRPAIDLGDYQSDDSAFRRITGWRPEVALEQGLTSTLAWFNERRSAYLD